MGDGICAYFGVPAAHEDDPERAASAALALQEVAGEYGREIAEAWGLEGFAVRVGINSGTAAVGVVGAGVKQAVALGDVTNVAARLQAAARPGDVMVGPDTAARLITRFELEPLGEIALRGRTEPVVAWRLVAPGAAVLRPPTPLVGRAEELRRLQEDVDELVDAGRGGVVFLSGDAGIGKTRLLAEARGARVEALWLQADCLPYGDQSLPIVSILREWLELKVGQSQLVGRAKLRARLGPVVGNAELRTLARLLRVRLEPADRSTTTESPGLVRAYTAWVEEIARRRPLVIALQDLHWADAMTCELAEALLELTERVPLILACTLRPDPEAEGWRVRVRALSQFAHRTREIRLEPLSQERSGDLLDALLPGGVDPAARSAMLALAEGNPLYLEELTRTLLEGGGLERRRTWTLGIQSSALLTPVLENLLVARLDLLPAAARRLSQIAAVAGRHFPVRLVERAAEDDEVEQHLTVLLRAEIIRERSRVPEREYSFRHGLFQEAALATLTPSARGELAGRVADAIEAVYAGQLDTQLERLAALHAQSGRLDTALGYLERAAIDAVEAQTGARARELLSRARALALKLGRTDAERRLGMLARRISTEVPAS